MKRLTSGKWAIYLLIPVFILGIMLSGCSDSSPAGAGPEEPVETAEPPQVQLINMTHIGDVSATAEAKVLDSGGAELTERGICWSTSGMPTIDEDHTKNLIKITHDSYWSSLSGLQKNTVYYARAYAKNATGKVGYSDTLRFEAGIDWNRAANRSIQSLIRNYWNSQGYFNTDNQSNYTFQYWPQAHAMDVLVKAYKRTGDDEYVQYIQDLYAGVHQKSGDFINNYYDDMEWNALAMLRMYHATNDTKFKTTVRQTLWPEIKGGWTRVIDGGIMWSKPTPKSKNACSNGPASILAANLYQIDHDEDDLNWAKKIFEWEKNHLVDPNTGVVWDHIKMGSDGETSIKKWTFTYNQGTYLGAALKLYDSTGESVYLDEAIKTADNTLNNLTKDGLLQKEGAGDGALFKAVFVRYFTQLIMEKDLSESVRDRYVDFIRNNARTLWNNGSNSVDNLFGRFWADKPDENVPLKADLSGVALIEAAAQLQAGGYFKK